MVEFWEGFTQISIVSIPTIVGALSSKFIINSWQIKKEKFRLEKEKHTLRKEILDDYEKAYTNQISMLNNFDSVVVGEYTIDYKIMSEKDKKIVFSIELPENKEDWPLKKISKEYKEHKREVIENLRNIWKLFSTVRIYYELKDINEIMTEISKRSNYAQELISVLMFSKTSKEFQENHTKFVIASDELRDSGHKISHILATSAIRSPEIKNKKRRFGKMKTIFKKSKWWMTKLFLKLEDVD